MDHFETKKLENFEAGYWKEQYQYKSFTPYPVNKEWIWDDPVINSLLEKAVRAVSQLNAFSLIVPHVDLFIQMHVIKEASKSSRIEGTKTNVEDAVKNFEDVDPEKRNDWQEVQNYIEAMNTAVQELKSLPLSNRLLKQTHAILMRGVRGETKAPGEFRTSQNWIGGSNLDNAVFIPPHESDVIDLMGDLESFLHNEKIHIPDLIRIAIAHYQFETIHPFLDGNGRIGRLLITLYMVSRSFLEKPSLYLSDWLEKNKGAYYDALTTVRHSGNIIHWIKFFLTAVIETAESGQDTFQKILALKNKTDSQILMLGKRAEKANTLMEYLYQKPLIDVTVAARLLDVTPQTAYNLIDDMENLGILYEITGYKRNRIYSFKEYMDLFRDNH